MKLSFTLQEKDYLLHQLYYFKTKESTKKDSRKAWFVAFLGIFLIVLLIYLLGDTATLYFSIALSIPLLILFPFYHKYRLKKINHRTVKEVHKTKFNKKIELFFDENHVLISSPTSESKLSYKVLEKIVEISNYYFIIFSSGMHLIIPKDQVNTDNVDEKLKQLTIRGNAEFSRELDWKW